MHCITYLSPQNSEAVLVLVIDSIFSDLLISKFCVTRGCRHTFLCQNYGHPDILALHQAPKHQWPYLLNKLRPRPSDVTRVGDFRLLGSCFHLISLIGSVAAQSYQLQVSKQADYIGKILF